MKMMQRMTFRTGFKNYGEAQKAGLAAGNNTNNKAATGAARNCDRLV